MFGYPPQKCTIVQNFNQLIPKTRQEYYYTILWVVSESSSESLIGNWLLVPVDERDGGESEGGCKDRVALDVDHERHGLEGVHDANGGGADVGREGLTEIDKYMSDKRVSGCYSKINQSYVNLTYNLGPRPFIYENHNSFGFCVSLPPLSSESIV